MKVESVSGMCSEILLNLCWLSLLIDCHENLSYYGPSSSIRFIFYEFPNYFITYVVWTFYSSIDRFFSFIAKVRFYNSTHWNVDAMPVEVSVP